MSNGEIDGDLGGLPNEEVDGDLDALSNYLH
jgi:hypothetical protein